MSKEICNILARNKRTSALVLGNTILPSRTISSAFKAVKLLNEKHIRNAVKAEQNGHIEIKDGIPVEALEFLNLAVTPKKVVADTDGDTDLEKNVIDTGTDVNLDKAEKDDDKDTDKDADKDANNDTDLEKKEESETDVKFEEQPQLAENPSDTLKEEEIHAMSGKDLKAYIAEKGLEIAGYNGMTTKEVKNAVLAFYGFEIIAE